jgi:hypothetical protein
MENKLREEELGFGRRKAHGSGFGIPGTPTLKAGGLPPHYRKEVPTAGADARWPGPPSLSATAVFQVNQSDFAADQSRKVLLLHPKLKSLRFIEKRKHIFKPLSPQFI